MKTCRKCGQVKPVDQFHKHPSTRDGLREKCKACIKEYQLVWREANLDAIKARAKAHRQTPGYQATKNERNRKAAEARRQRLGNEQYLAEHRRKMMGYRLRSAYGITVDDVDLMLREQNHACRLCRCPLSPTYRNVDHDHQTGRIRGLLCNQCNTALGNFKENPKVIAGAIRYLTELALIPCAICGIDLSETKHYQRHIDHCHETGRVRGLLCERCNRGLGQFEDDPERMQRAMDYLARSTAY